MEKRIRHDEEPPRVYIELSKRNMMLDLRHFMKDRDNKLKDSDEFSDELKENIKLLKERFD